jgi:hypothetical protein
VASQPQDKEFQNVAKTYKEGYAVRAEQRGQQILPQYNEYKIKEFLIIRFLPFRGKTLGVELRAS